MTLDVLDAVAPSLACFRSYDVRGEFGRDLTPEIAKGIGGAIAEVLQPDVVVVGRDCRLSGPELSAALIAGLTTQGIDVVDLGLAGTEEVYFAVAHIGAGAGIAITASHNPAKDNGMKIVGPGSAPLSAEAFREIERLSQVLLSARKKGSATQGDFRDVYARYLVDQIDVDALRDVHIVANAGYGVAGAACDAILAELRARGCVPAVTWLNHRPDGHFPMGVPNPLLPSMRAETERAVISAGADFAVAWDGDFDRCFLFDDTGMFVDGAYFAALLAGIELERSPGAAVIHDARVVWPMRGIAHHNGRAEVARTGHVHMKHAMLETGAVYGGEMSGHNYFRSFFNCDTGMLPWLKLLEYMGKTGASLRELVADIAAAHPVSGEINYRATSPQHALQRLRDEYGAQARDVDTLDGLSLTFEDWRVNLRSSSTEPLLRMNIETRGDAALLAERRDALDAFLRHSVGCLPA